MNLPFYCSRTGQTFPTESMALSIAGSCDAPAVAVQKAIPITGYDRAGNLVSALDTRERDITGKLLTNQQNSSQYWMNGGYTGESPSYESTLYYSDAQYAYDNAVAIAKAAAASFPRVNPAIAALSNGQTEQANTYRMETPDEVSNFLGGVSQSANQVMGWLTQNFLLVVIVVAGVLFLPRLFDVATRRWA